MAQSSSQILEQITKQYGNPTDASNIIESTIRDAYAPSVKNLIQEGNTLRGEYYPAFFNEAQKLGTTAADMSPAARLAAMQQAGESSGQLYRTNLGLRDYYKTDINSMIDRAMQMYNAGYGSLKDMYNMALSDEQARAVINANNVTSDYYKKLMNPTPATTNTPVDLKSIPDVMEWNQDNLDTLKEIGAKTVKPIMNGNTVVGYIMRLPDGREVQVGMNNIDIPQYEKPVGAQYTNLKYQGKLLPDQPNMISPNISTPGINFPISNALGSYGKIGVGRTF